jgi:hypothetical protein
MFPPSFRLLLVIVLSTLTAPAALAQIHDSTWTTYRDLPETVKASKPGPSAYRIQLFSGTRTDALAIRNQARALVPDSGVSLNFDAPYFKVYGGFYAYRMQAEKHLPAWRVLFPGAFVVSTATRRSTVPRNLLR